MRPVEILKEARADGLKRSLEACETPVLLKGCVSDWPAVRVAQEAGHAAICEYLQRFDSGREMFATKTRAAAKGVMGYNESLTDFAFVKARMGLADFVAHLQAYAAVEGAPSIAAQCAKVEDILPGFTAENPMAALPGVAPNFWLGNALTVPVHHDHPYNLACVVAGRRRFTLFAPEQVGNLYIGPLEFTPSGAPISVVSPHQPDPLRYPRYQDALDAALVAELEPGDALYIPPLWFHQVEALEKVNLLVNYWWPVEGDPQGSTPVASLMQAIAVLNALPRAQREAWAAMFDHYVVQRQTDPAAHIPDALKGVLARRS